MTTTMRYFALGNLIVMSDSGAVCARGKSFGFFRSFHFIYNNNISGGRTVIRYTYLPDTPFWLELPVDNFRFEKYVGISEPLFYVFLLNSFLAEFSRVY